MNVQQRTGTFREMVPEDAVQVLDLSRQYFEESDWGEYSTFSPHSILKRLEWATCLESVKGIVFLVGTDIKGMLGMSYDKLCQAEPTATISYIYVAPEYRRSPVGRLLLDMAEEMAVRDGCVAIDVNFQSGIENVRKTFENLFTKRGYTQTWGGRKILKGMDQ